MKMLLGVTSAIEAGAGLALGCFPAAVVKLLLGSHLPTPNSGFHRASWAGCANRTSYGMIKLFDAVTFPAENQA
jgi:hypothetical protein